MQIRFLAQETNIWSEFSTAAAIVDI